MLVIANDSVSNHPDVKALHHSLSGLSAPFVIYNKSHSGSRLLTRALAAQGVFIGSRRNDSEDSLPFAELIHVIVGNYYPDYQSLWRDREAVARLARLALAATQEHLARYDATRFRGWGWKMCESGYALPVLTQLFPTLKAIHLLRDGMDVAFTDHIAPELPFWRKIYFDTAELPSWQGLSLSNRSYEQRSYLFNAVHWANSVNVGRRHGSMLAERYVELRYEQLCGNFRSTMEHLLAFMALTPDERALTEIDAGIHQTSVGKHQHRPTAKRRKVLELIAPQLLAFGYGKEVAPTKYPPLVAKLLDRFGWAG